MPEGCVEYTGYRTPFGYGRQRHNGRMWLAHRVSYEKAFGPIPDGLFVCHRCDNPPCINSDHLFLGTQKENVRDMIAKGRKPGNTKSNPIYAKKLTPEDVRQIRCLNRLGVQRKWMCLLFGVNKQTMSKVCNVRTWKDA